MISGINAGEIARKGRRGPSKLGDWQSHGIAWNDEKNTAEPTVPVLWRLVISFIPRRTGEKQDRQTRAEEKPWNKEASNGFDLPV